MSWFISAVDSTWYTTFCIIKECLGLPCIEHFDALSLLSLRHRIETMPPIKETALSRSVEFIGCIKIYSSLHLRWNLLISCLLELMRAIQTLHSCIQYWSWLGLLADLEIHSFLGGSWRMWWRHIGLSFTDWAISRGDSSLYLFLGLDFFLHLMNWRFLFQMSLALYVEILNSLYFLRLRVVKVKLTLESVRVQTFCKSVFVLKASCRTLHQSLILRISHLVVGHVWTVFSYNCEPGFRHLFLYVICVSSDRLITHHLFTIPLQTHLLSNRPISLWNRSTSWF